MGQTQTPQEIARLGQEALLPRLQPAFLDPCDQNGQANPDGKPDWIRLAYAGETKIRRHVKIRRRANPFDPCWQPYLTERALRKKFGVTRQTVKKTIPS